MSEVQGLLVNRINQVEKWLAKLDLYNLTQAEAVLLIDPVEKVKDEVFKDLVEVCRRRYKHSNYFPDFSEIGYEYKRELKKLRRHFMLSL